MRLPKPISYFLNFPFLFGLFLFAFSLYLALGLALTLAEKITLAEINPPGGGFSAWQFIILFACATLILLLILKYFKKPWLIQGLFYLAIIEGLLFFCQAYFPWPNYLYVVAFLLLGRLLYRNVLFHNLIVIMAISAIAVIFGLNFSPGQAIFILLILAAYDFWAVYKTKHMVKMFQGLAEAKVHFSLVIPQSWGGLFKKAGEVSPQSEFMFLGTGDLAIPAIFIIACLKISLLTALITALGAIGGFILLYLIFISQKQKQPMPGLPPLVLGALLGYLIALLFYV